MRGTARFSVESSSVRSPSSSRRPLLSGWQAALIKAGVGHGTIHKARTLLSSVLRHAAENGAIMANPLSVVRSPRSAPRDAARPLAPAVVERIREAMLNPPDREISASAPGNRARRRYTLPAPGTPQTRQRDALIVSILAYAGLRPGELRALPWEGLREYTILVQHAANPDGSSKPPRTGSTARSACCRRSRRTRASTSSRSAGHRRRRSSCSPTTASRGTRTRGRCGAPTAGRRHAERWDSIPSRARMT